MWNYVTVFHQNRRISFFWLTKKNRNHRILSLPPFSSTPSSLWGIWSKLHFTSTNCHLPIIPGIWRWSWIPVAYACSTESTKRAQRARKSRTKVWIGWRWSKGMQEKFQRKRTDWNHWVSRIKNICWTPSTHTHTHRYEDKLIGVKTDSILSGKCCRKCYSLKMKLLNLYLSVLLVFLITQECKWTMDYCCFLKGDGNFENDFTSSLILRKLILHVYSFL